VNRHRLGPLIRPADLGGHGELCRARARPPGGTLAAVLLVDDDDDVRSALAAALAGMGHDVVQAASGLQALEVIDRQVPLDLLLTDVVMPGLHGFNLARMTVLRRRDIRILYMSGYTDVDVVTRDSGPRYGKLLEKPLRLDDLRLEVEQALTRPPP
jgi:DNA-binding NtrC family response regulator